MTRSSLCEACRKTLWPLGNVWIINYLWAPRAAGSPRRTVRLFHSTLCAPKLGLQTLEFNLLTQIFKAPFRRDKSLIFYWPLNCLWRSSLGAARKGPKESRFLAGPFRLETFDQFESFTSLFHALEVFEAQTRNTIGRRSQPLQTDSHSNFMKSLRRRDFLAFLNDRTPQLSIGSCVTARLAKAVCSSKWVFVSKPWRRF